MCVTLKIIQQMVMASDLVGPGLVPFYRQLLPMFNAYKTFEGILAFRVNYMLIAVVSQWITQQIHFTFHILFLYPILHPPHPTISPFGVHIACHLHPQNTTKSSQPLAKNHLTQQNTMHFI